MLYLLFLLKTNEINGINPSNVFWKHDSYSYSDINHPYSFNPDHSKIDDISKILSELFVSGVKPYPTCGLIKGLSLNSSSNYVSAILTGAGVSTSFNSLIEFFNNNSVYLGSLSLSHGNNLEDIKVLESSIDNFYSKLNDSMIGISNRYSIDGLLEIYAPDRTRLVCLPLEYLLKNVMVSSYVDKEPEKKYIPDDLYPKTMVNSLVINQNSIFFSGTGLSRSQEQHLCFAYTRQNDSVPSCSFQDLFLHVSPEFINIPAKNSSEFYSLLSSNDLLFLIPSSSKNEDTNEYFNTLAVSETKINIKSIASRILSTLNLSSTSTSSSLCHVFLNPLVGLVFNYSFLLSPTIMTSNVLNAYQNKLSSMLSSDFSGTYYSTVKDSSSRVSENSVLLGGSRVTLSPYDNNEDNLNKNLNNYVSGTFYRASSDLINQEKNSSFSFITKTSIDVNSSGTVEKYIRAGLELSVLNLDFPKAIFAVAFQNLLSSGTLGISFVDKNQSSNSLF
jgi:hypothetical protein